DEQEDATDATADYYDSQGRGAGAVNKTMRRALDISRRVCNLEVNIDHTLFQKYYVPDEDAALTRERLTDLISVHVQRANSIYGATNFGGIEDISFVVQSIKINDTSHCLGTQRLSNPFCISGIDSAHMLHIASLANHDDFCLSYTWTYRDFADGILGLAWIAKRDVGSGGICEKHRMSVELAPGTNKYKEFRMSLNSGIVTFQNYNNFVPLYISTITFAHEIGHNFGSPHDDGSLCVPGGRNGNYIMYASATKGTLPNNDKFSPCSIRNISSVLVPFFSGETNRENCFQKNSGPICGNEIREGDEECDCGLDASECRDKCCYPRRNTANRKGCTLKDYAICSPTAGQCCTKDCKVARKGLLCKEHTMCTEESYCEYPFGIEATCPNATWKANMTACNRNTQVCLAGECTGSICFRYKMAECMLSGHGLTPDKLCILGCQESREYLDGCKDVCDIPRMVGHCGLKMQPGSPCDAMRGYCDVFQVCRSVDPDGPLTRLQRFFFGGEAISTTIDFIADHPFISVLALLGSAWFMVLVFRCFAVHTPSNNPLKKPPYKLKDTIKHPLNVF
ncbi:unnamed protein product, partial [Ixodes hexagonus]